MKNILALLFLLPQFCWACGLEIIAFKGLDSHFDHRSFNEFVKRKAACAKVYEWERVTQAVIYINSSSIPYYLYGFSKGAESVAQVLKQTKRMPKYAVTIGAWYTVDLDFSKYKIKFNNYFDESGRNQKSPGEFIPNVPHMKMQEYVNNLLFTKL